MDTELGEGERAVNWESGADIHPLPCVRQPASEELLV